MDVQLINPFIEATINVLTTMARITPQASAPQLKVDNRTWGIVTGVIGMAGDKVSGNLCVSFDKESALEIVGNMFGEPFTAINEEIVDAVGEITNMITGGTKKLLAEKGYKFEMATPMMIKGRDVELRFLGGSPVIQVPFATSKGKFVVEANLVPNRKDR